MAKCELCNKEMNSAKGCSVGELYVGTKKYPRIRCGSKDDFMSDMKDGERCGDCGAVKGYFHHYHCDMERCPVCGEQLLSCDCPVSYSKPRMNGTIKLFYSDKGYGFITGEDEKDYFVHFSDIARKMYRELRKGDRVSFELGANEKNPRIHAVNVKPIITKKKVDAALKRDGFHLIPKNGMYGEQLWIAVDENNVIQSSENGMSLLEFAENGWLTFTKEGRRKIELEKEWKEFLAQNRDDISLEMQKIGERLLEQAIKAIESYLTNDIVKVRVSENYDYISAKDFEELNMDNMRDFFKYDDDLDWYMYGGDSEIFSPEEVALLIDGEFNGVDGRMQIIEWVIDEYLEAHPELIDKYGQELCYGDDPYENALYYCVNGRPADEFIRDAIDKYFTCDKTENLLRQNPLYAEMFKELDEFRKVTHKMYKWEE